MKTLLTSISILIFIVQANSQTLKQGAINLSSEASPSTGVILRKTNLHRLVESKTKPASAKQELIKEVFPLPFTDNINIEFSYAEKQNFSILIFDVLGNLKKEFLIEKPKDNFYQNLEVNDLSAGIYFLQARLLNTNKTSRVKLIKIN